MTTKAPTYTQAEKDYQLSRPNETSVGGLTEYRIATLVIVEIAVLLRMVGRRQQKIPLRADDYILLVSAALMVGYAVCGVLSVKYGYGHHTLVVRQNFKAVFPIRAKAGYVGNFLYNTGFPLSRISLILLYKRVFVQKWFGYVCWFMVFCYSCYSLATCIISIFLVYPVQAYWDQSIKVTRAVDGVKLVRANCCFNIISDVILLVLPLSIIWRLQMRSLHKLGLSAIFCLGALTLVASVMRFYYNLTTDPKDPEFTGAPGSWWTVTELHLGILCPSLVTYKPLIVVLYRAFVSRLSPRGQSFVSRLTGVDPSVATKTKTQQTQDEETADALEESEEPSFDEKPSTVEVKKTAVHTEKAVHGQV